MADWTEAEWAKAKADMLKEIETYEGLEVPEYLWPICERLVADKKITLSYARGPGKFWRRAELVEED